MKKLLTLVLALALTLSLAACGEKPAPAAPDPAPAAPVEDAAPTEDAAPAEGEIYTLDYDTIASWVNFGFIGNDASGSPVVMAMDEANEYAIIIFADNSDMTAASMMGPIVYDDANSSASITDEVNGMVLTFGLAQVDEATIELDMGDIGTATVTAAPLDELLATIEGAVVNYNHIA